MFKVGDRVEFIGDTYGQHWLGQLATVHKVTEKGPHVDFDNPSYQKLQSRSLHWPMDGYFRVVDAPESFEFDV